MTVFTLPATGFPNTKVNAWNCIWNAEFSWRKNWFGPIFNVKAKCGLWYTLCVVGLLKTKGRTLSRLSNS